MLYDPDYVTRPTGRFSGPEPHTSLSEVINFVEKHLPYFSSRYSASVVQNEDGLTQNLCRILEFHRNTEPFWFVNEYMEIPEKGNSPRIDIGVFTKLIDTDRVIFSFEAKRLVFTTGDREKEYVIGSGNYSDRGGIERFKKNIHGQGLEDCGMIGYVQKKDFKYWHEKINFWIDELIKDKNHNLKWDSKDRLVKDYEKPFTAKYNSKHSRLKDGPINLTHLWVLLGN